MAGSSAPTGNYDRVVTSTTPSAPRPRENDVRRRVRAALHLQPDTRLTRPEDALTLSAAGYALLDEVERLLSDRAGRASLDYWDWLMAHVHLEEGARCDGEDAEAEED